MFDLPFIPAILVATAPGKTDWTRIPSLRHSAATSRENLSTNACIENELSTPIYSENWRNKTGPTLVAP